jgi:hypothetical protein
VVESDEQQVKLNQVIGTLKKQIDAISGQITKAQDEFREVKN